MPETNDKQPGVIENEQILDRNDVPAFGLDGEKIDLESLKKLDPDRALELFQTAQVNYLMGTGLYQRVKIMLEPDPKVTIQNSEKYCLYATKKPGAASKPTTKIITTTGRIVSTP